METTVINIPSFQGPYKSGLVFALVEGLKPGQQLKLLCKEDPMELENMLRSANLLDVRWEARADALKKTWELVVRKFDPHAESSGCCGGCGSTNYKEGY